MPDEIQPLIASLSTSDVTRRRDAALQLAAASDDLRLARLAQEAMSQIG